MKAARQVFSVVCLTFVLAVSSQKDDESLPYEFGFTIDGQQHRHEKKDANGIIQGEFGFITADGVYHVTVYATDENGNFKILSMRNIRVSGPLDGSGPPGEAKKQPAAAGRTALQPATAAPSSSSPAPVPSTTTPKAYLRFTTQSTIKPACAGCGYVELTSPKTPPANQPTKFDLQTPPFKNEVEPAAPPAAGFGGSPGAGAPYGRGGESGSGYGPESGGNPPQGAYPGQGFGGPAQNLENQDQQYPSGSPEGAAVPQGYADQSPPGLQLDLRQGPPSSRLSEVSVSDGAIHVPGNPDIPIQDKYPNMEDGLPPGIEEQDITDLLYKFNYTVGFHGHYEKGYKDGTKVGGYFVNGRDGLSRIVTYVADANGYHPKVKFLRLGLDSPDTPKEETEKTFGLKSFEFVWYPIS